MSDKERFTELTVELFRIEDELVELTTKVRTVARAVLPMALTEDMEELKNILMTFGVIPPPRIPRPVPRPVSSYVIGLETKETRKTRYFMVYASNAEQALKRFNAKHGTYFEGDQLKSGYKIFLADKIERIPPVF